MRRPEHGLYFVKGLRPSESAAAPGFYHCSLIDHSILPGKWAGLLWVREWTWCDLRGHLGHGGGHTRKWAAIDPYRDGEVGRLGVWPRQLPCPTL